MCDENYENFPDDYNKGDLISSYPFAKDYLKPNFHITRTDIPCRLISRTIPPGECHGHSRRATSGTPDTANV